MPAPHHTAPGYTSPDAAMHWAPDHGVCPQAGRQGRSPRPPAADEVDGRRSCRFIISTDRHERPEATTAGRVLSELGRIARALAWAPLCGRRHSTDPDRHISNYLVTIRFWVATLSDSQRHTVNVITNPTPISHWQSLVDANDRRVSARYKRRDCQRDQIINLLLGSAMG